MSEFALNQKSVSLSNDTWKETKAKAFNHAVAIKENLPLEKQILLDKICTSIQTHLNGGTLDNNMLSRFTMRLKTLGLSARETDKFLHSLIIISKHQGSGYKVANFFGITYKTDTLKKFIKPHINSEYKHIIDNTTDEVLEKAASGIIKANIAQVYKDKDLCDEAQGIFNSLNLMSSYIRMQLIDIVNANLSLSENFIRVNSCEHIKLTEADFIKD